GAFGMLAAATGSPTFAGAATVAQLIASLPTFTTRSPLVGDWSRPRVVEVASAAEMGVESWLSFVRPTHIVLEPGAPPEKDLAAYPTARPFEVVGERRPDWEGAEPRPIVAFPTQNGDGYQPLDPLVTEHLPDVDTIIGGRERVLRPQVGNAFERPPSQ